MKSYKCSEELNRRAQGVLAGGVSSEFRKFSHPHPLFYERGEGARLWDADGNEFLDFTLSQGPLILGHSHPRVLESIENASRRGQLFAGQHIEELELAETLQRLIPCAELMRFSLSGSECDHAALRLARAATGRPKFLRFEGHYHGWFDNAALGNAGTLEQIGPREHPTPAPWTQGLPPRLEDELIVLPWMELIANGTVLHAGTMNSSTPCVAAALSTVQVLEEENIHPRLFALGEKLREGLQAAASETGHADFRVQGPGPMLHAAFSPQPVTRDYRDTLGHDKARYARFVAGMQERGVRLIGRGLWYLSGAHTPADIQTALVAARATLSEMSAAAPVAGAN